MIVYWELTTACGLACRHCRATAMPDAAPGQLTTDEALTVLDQVAGFGGPLPHVVMTGGDPLRRPDLDLLVTAATERGIGVSLAPAVTPLLTRDRLAELQHAGVTAISLSLDGSDAAHHDAVRGVTGTFDATLRALEDAAALGLPVQVNTLVAESTVDDLPAVLELLRTRTLLRWSLFFLVSVGRGTQLREVDAGRAEQVLQWLHGLRRPRPELGFHVSAVEAMQHRRIAVRAMRRRGLTDAEIEDSPVGRGFGVRDGNGIVFVAHDGTVHPSGFMPMPLGNLRTDDLVELYRHHPDLVALRDVTLLKGRCGRCPFARWCGGSRARALAWTGDPLESDPLCPYQPGEHDEPVGEPVPDPVGER
jgi:radical SAM protein